MPPLFNRKGHGRARVAPGSAGFAGFGFRAHLHRINEVVSAFGVLLDVVLAAAVALGLVAVAVCGRSLFAAKAWLPRENTTDPSRLLSRMGP